MSKRSRLLGRRVLIALFCLYLGGMAALYVVLPKRDFSENEKRVLAKLPALTASTVTDGSFESGFEKWMSDHVPGRDALVGLHMFDDYVLFGYAIKLKLLERLSSFEHDKGKAEFKSLFDGIQQQVYSL